MDLDKQLKHFDGALTLPFHAFTHYPPHPFHLQDLKDSSVQGLQLPPFFSQKFPLFSLLFRRQMDLLLSEQNTEYPRTHEMEILQWMFVAVV